MLNGKRTWLTTLVLGVIALSATPAFARSISLKDAGATLWIFIIIGAVIVLLQLIPAAILFFSFIGTSSNMIFKRGKEAEEAASEGKSALPGIEPAAVNK
jgi:membrane associated rhomboid family serine protease